MRKAPVTESMVSDYLSGPPYTLGTYCARTLRGKAKRYARRYIVRMRALLSADPDVVRVPSIRGGVAYRA